MSRPKSPACLTRKQFLFAGGAALATVLLPGLPGEQRVWARVAGYPKRRIGLVSRLAQDEPVSLRYPHDHAQCDFLLVKLGEEAAGGVGPDKDIAAFSNICSHMGAPLRGLYKREFKALGPCRRHLTVFDLRRRGMVSSGHAVETLPQLVLETKGDAIYATGVLGLLYGFQDSKDAPR